LDIGCGEGICDILIGYCFEPTLIVGVDLDFNLIKKAVENLKSIDQKQLIGFKHIIQNSMNLFKY
jgi:tRNA1(Val) A37 N6-methylase TrmN6